MLYLQGIVYSLSKGQEVGWKGQVSFDRYFVASKVVSWFEMLTSTTFFSFDSFVTQRSADWAKSKT